MELRELLSLYDDQAPLERASTIPAGWYTDRRIFNLEREAIFGGSWQVVGRADQVEEPGRYFTADLAGEPIVVVRGADGQLRAFYNVCRHHAAEVVTAAEGSAQVFRCPYHGWTYGLDGSLKGTPDFLGVCEFNRGANGLVPVRVESWEKFILVSLDAHTPLEQFLKPVASQIAALDLESLRFYQRREYTLGCNWKVYVDNYLDGGYHVPYLHKGLDSVLEYSEYTIETGENYCLQWSPLVTSEKDAAVAATRKGDRAYYYWLFPNFMINLYEGVMDTNLVLPDGVDRTRVIFDFYFADVRPESAARNEQSLAVSHTVQEEDVGICEAVQRGLRSRAYQAGRLSVRREAGEHLFHRLLAKRLRIAADQHASVDNVAASLTD